MDFGKSTQFITKFMFLKKYFVSAAYYFEINTFIQTIDNVMQMHKICITDTIQVQMFKARYTQYLLANTKSYTDL